LRNAQILIHHSRLELDLQSLLPGLVAHRLHSR
jgi:hypothetical protein